METATTFRSYYRCNQCHTIETYDTRSELTMAWTVSHCTRCSIRTRWYKRTAAQVRAALGYTPSDYRA